MIKPINEYSKNKTKKDGLSDWCKSCSKEYYKAWRKNNINQLSNIVVLRKVCSTCGTEKPATEFRKQKGNLDGLGYQCKACASKSEKRCYEKNKTKRRKQNIASYYRNRETKLAYREAYYQQNKDEILEYHFKYRRENKDRLQEYFKQHYQQNKNKINAYLRKRRRENKHVRMRENLQKRITGALKGVPKTGTTMELIGCTVSELKKHIEKQFRPGMNWDNWTVDGWHLDHIRPCASFDLTDPEQQKECFHYTNLQPLWGEENLRKGARV
jgi:hypothetical protein